MFDSMQNKGIMCRCGERYPSERTRCPLCGRWRDDIRSAIVPARIFNYSSIAVLLVATWCLNLYRIVSQHPEEGDFPLRVAVVMMVAGIVLSLISLPFWSRVSRKIGTWWWW